MRRNVTSKGKINTAFGSAHNEIASTDKLHRYDSSRLICAEANNSATDHQTPKKSESMNV